MHDIRQKKSCFWKLVNLEEKSRKETKADTKDMHLTMVVCKSTAHRTVKVGRKQVMEL